MMIIMNGMKFELTVQDFGTHNKVRVYQDKKVIGFKDFPIRVELSNGVIEWTVKSLLRGNDGQNQVSIEL